MDNEGKKLVQFPRRIKGRHSESFRTATFDSNYFHVTTKDEIKEIYIFKVVFTPIVQYDNSKLRITLLQKGISEIKQFINGPVISGSNIYSTKAPSEKEKTIRVQEYDILIKQVKVLDLDSNPKSLLQFMNNALRNLLRRLDYTQIGRSGKFFNSRGSQDLDSDLKMFSGVKANFMKLENGIYLRVDSAKKIVRNQTVLDYINSIYQVNKEKDRDQKRNLVQSGLIGQTIMTNYGKTRYLRVTDVIFQSVDQVKLENSDTTLRQFYDTKYNRKINNPKQPLLIVENNNKSQTQRTIIVPEFCLMTGIPDSFDEFKRKKVSEATIKSASEKKAEIQKFMRKVQDSKDFVFMKDIGVNLDHRMQNIKGKIIPAPKLALGQDRAVQKGRQSGFQLFRDPIYSNSHSLKCGIIAAQNVDLKCCIDTFRNTSSNLKIKFESTVISIKQTDRRRITEAILNSIDSAVRKQVIPNFLKNNYEQFKKQCLQKSKVVSQCVVQSTLRKKNLQSIATKILLQMIAKRGNTLWVPKLSIPLKDTMIMAFDTAKGQKGNVLSCCATVNSTFSSVFSKTSTYPSNESKFQEMKKHSLEIIQEYAKQNSRVPKEIIMFHNSTSGDQMKIFREFFLDDLISELEKSYKQESVSLTFVMVNTKTSQRFFLEDRSGVKNVQAGTLVSSQIVSENYDFYLVSQFSNRGSIVPNHYKIVFSNSKLQEGILQELIYSQCFNYVNWTGSIKVPGILQYAKKCAKFSAEALSCQKVHDDLEGTLYFV